MEKYLTAALDFFKSGITPEIVTMWVIMAVVAVVSFLATRNLKDEPGFLQNIMEMAVEKLEGFFVGVIGEKKARTYFPYLGSLFMFIIISNYSGLIPGMGLSKHFGVPTSSLSVTAGLAITVFFATHFLGVKENGLLGYGKHFIKPMAFMLPLLIIEEIVRPVSLSLRLYGNVFGEESVTEQLYELLPIGAPIIMMVLSLLFCLIQAVVFTMLTAIYIDGATSPAH